MIIGRKGNYLGAPHIYQCDECGNEIDNKKDRIYIHNEKDKPEQHYCGSCRRNGYARHLKKETYETYCFEISKSNKKEVIKILDKLEKKGKIKDFREFYGYPYGT